MALLRHMWVIGIGVFIICAASHPVEGASPILVGATVSREGRYQEPSKMIRLSYRLWEKQVNETGGLLGRPVRLVLYDDKSQKELVRQYYEKLIVQDKVDLVLAPYSTGLTYVASEVTEQHRLVLLASGASGEMIWQRGYKYVFGVYGLAKRYFIGFLDLTARNGLQTVVILDQDTLFTRDAANGAQAWAGRLGLKILERHTYHNSETEFPLLLGRIKNLKPDALLLCSYPPDGYRFLQALAKADFHPRALALSITPSLPDFYEKAGPLAEGVFGPSQWEPDERIPFPGTRRFIRAFVDFTGVSPSYHAGTAFAACQLLQQSIGVVGALDHPKIRDHIAALDTVTVIGRFKVDPQGRQIGHTSIIIQWLNGKKEIVYPTKMQTAPPRFNSPSR